jgi:hypothetical protein
MKAERVSRGVPRGARARLGDTKLTAPVTLFAQIEAEQHEALRALAFAGRCSIADVVRKALGEYLAKHPRRSVGRRAAVAAGGGHRGPIR